MLPPSLDPGRRWSEVDRLLAGYRAGAFPMGDPDSGEIDWFEADPRAVFPLEPGAFHISRRLERTVRSRCLEVTSDEAFESVLEGCAESRPGREETWITPPLMRWYGMLRAAGHAHSVEAWARDASGERVLVGGVYGVQLGGAFLAESKFSRPECGGRDASKVCLVHLVRHLRARGFELLDVQLHNSHLEQFGPVEVPARAFRRLLEAASDRDVQWHPWGDYAGG